MSAKIALAVLGGSLMSCRSDNHEPAKQLALYCSLLAIDLAYEVETYADLATIPDDAPPDVQRRAGRTLRFGGTEDGRGAVALELSRSFQLCASVRRGDAHELEEREVRFTKLSEDFVTRVPAPPDRAALGKTMREMADMFAAISRLPMKE